MHPFFPLSNWLLIFLDNLAISILTSGIIVTSAPAPIPASMPSQPQFLPITSTIWVTFEVVAVSLILSIALNAVLIAVSKPIVGPTKGMSLSIVAGITTHFVFEILDRAVAPFVDPSPPIITKPSTSSARRFFSAISLYFLFTNLDDLEVCRILPPF